MLINPSFDSFFVKAIKALRPYLHDVVCIGGCANALYRHHPRSSASALISLGTYDLDLAVEQRVPVRGGITLSRIMADMGTEPEMFGSENEAVIKYRPKDSDIAAEIEFLCDAGGVRGGRSNRKAPAAIAVQKELHAQPLRYLEILLKHPWTINPGAVAGLTGLKGITVQIPNPAAYIMQKILIQNEGRKPADMAKDFYYIFEISVIFRDAGPKLIEEYDRLTHWVPPKWRQRFRADMAAVFANEYADGPVMAARVYRDSTAGMRDASMPVNERIVADSVKRMMKEISGGML